MNLLVKRIIFFELVLSTIIVLVYSASLTPLGFLEYFISCSLVIHGVFLLAGGIIWLGELWKIF